MLDFNCVYIELKKVLVRVRAFGYLICFQGRREEGGGGEKDPAHPNCKYPYVLRCG